MFPNPFAMSHPKQTFAYVSLLICKHFLCKVRTVAGASNLASLFTPEMFCLAYQSLCWLYGLSSDFLISWKVIHIAWDGY